MLKNNIHLAVERIANELPDPSEDMGLLTGEAGKALFYSYFSKLQGDNRFDDKIEASLVQVFDLINNGNLGTGFCSGLAGIVWCIEHLTSVELLEVDLDLEAIWGLLEEAVIYHSKRGYFDFLQGANGIVYSLLQCKPDKSERVITQWLEMLLYHAHKDKEGYVWDTILRKDSNQIVRNLSLSHGSSNTILVLTETLKHFPDNKLALQLVEGAVCYLMNSKHRSGFNCCFPPYISPGEEPGQSRLAWCYGDLGNAVALWGAGKLLQRTEWMQCAIEVMLFSAGRKNLELEHVTDACFCHGSAGIAQAFNHFYHETGRPEFDLARMYWLDQTLAFGKRTGGIGGYLMDRGSENAFVPEAGLLEGAAGVGMVLLDFLSEDKNRQGWDACFLLN
jgi:lantibiotic modifying enzyme